MFEEILKIYSTTFTLHPNIHTIPSLIFQSTTTKVITTAFLKVGIVKLSIDPIQCRNNTIFYNVGHTYATQMKWAPLWTQVQSASLVYQDCILYKFVLVMLSCKENKEEIIIFFNFLFYFVVILIYFKSITLRKNFQFNLSKL